MKTGTIILIWAALLAACTSLNAQSVIKGSVRESTSGDPLPFVNVFLSNTTFGTTTANDGTFKFQVPIKGKYELVASFVGYAPVRVPLIVGKDSVFNSTLTLAPSIFELPAIIVRADTSTRQKDFHEFRRLFLGESQLGSSCRIRNPKSIYVYHDKEQHELLAYAREPIIIENKALGYRVHFELVHFRYSFANTTLNVRGIPRFEELPVDRTPEKRKRNRNKAYFGSLTHFLHSCLANQLYEEGWQAVVEYARIKPAESVIDQKIEVYKRMHNQDSIDYYKRIKLLPPKSFDQSPYLHGRELLSAVDNHHFIFKGKLLVTYLKENNERPPSSGRTRGQWSIIEFHRIPIILYENGYFEPQEYLEVTGYMGWEERVSGFLPLGFTPYKIEP